MKTKNYTTGSFLFKGFVVMLFAVLTQNAWAQTYLWATRTGSTATDGGNSMVTDASGNVYIAGFFRGTVDFDPGTGIVNLISAGDADIFVQKLNASGNLVWAKRMGGTGNDGAYGVAVDGSGNVFLTGFFQETADFDPGTGFASFESYGSYDVFVEKLNSSGDMVWVKRVGNTGHDVGRGIDIDASGNVFVTGNFSNTLDFDPGLSSYNKTSVGGYDIFVLKLNSLGSFEGVYTGGGTGNDAGQGIAVKSSYAYVTGYFKGSVDFDPNVDTPTYTAVGETDIFMMRIETTGGMDFDFVCRVGGTGADAGQGIAVDAMSNVIVAGYFTGTVDFNPGTATNNLAAAGNTDAFVLKLTSGGAYSWAKKMGGSSADKANSVAVDGSALMAVAGNVYVTGSFTGTVDFDPGASTFNLVSAGSTDVFVQKLTSGGVFSWAKRAGGTGGDEGNGIAVNWSNNAAHTTGSFNNTVDFNPNAGIANLYSAGSTDIFVQKLSAPAACALAVSTGFIVHATCGTGGSATVIISGGASPFTTLWSNGNTNLTANNLNNGTYTVTVTDNDGCTQTASAYIGSVAPAVPSSITATATNTSITVQWATVANAATYGVRIRKQGTPEWTYINLLAGSSATITGLQSCSTYEYGVKSNCTGGTSSNYSATQYKQTTGCAAEGKTDLTGANVWNTLKLYPNPARQNVTLDYASATEQEITISLYDLNGRLVLQQNAHVYDGSNLIAIDISLLVPGFYMVETGNETQRQREKLIVSE
ncbi:T9SS C-terminal target domain-containing protein [Sphingobacteriales bacterium UPWRP_1]|nr:hypothetical protein BVG80_12020 [Sphingobacteriales bacterium TSM_CSM]PSJ77949.1 T9SS C-terminal target domain-containing protein [Sphingobacteriales bacterium UPWRP_1]